MITINLLEMNVEYFWSSSLLCRLEKKNKIKEARINAGRA
jgi:hypothetical protein